ncbi:hypothetical protein HYC85_013684 [Camellia sinensis]|uniref:Uncharacterized protein n=1 Tax=Camellia sinensis TaxID=4442 RepID=A0A7J7H595_CAMSI|nr:hypothetical protein HYC85_013684 [Camellia sinensis]
MGVGPSGKGLGSLKQRSRVRVFVDAANPLGRGSRICARQLPRRISPGSKKLGDTVGDRKKKKKSLIQT